MVSWWPYFHELKKVFQGNGSNLLFQMLLGELSKAEKFGHTGYAMAVTSAVS
jgi:hypothetical protein